MCRVYNFHLKSEYDFMLENWIKLLAFQISFTDLYLGLLDRQPNPDQLWGEKSCLGIPNADGANWSQRHLEE